MTVSSSDAQRGEIDEDATSGAVTLEVTLSESSTEVVTVAYATADFSSTDTAVSSSSIDPATAGADYTAASGTLTFAAGDTRKTITVSISDDVNRERDELFKVGLSSATGGATIASTGSEATILIDDDDPRPKATITASVPGLTSTGAPGGTFTTPEGFLSVAEGDSGNTDITFTVTLEGADYLNTSFSVSSTDGSATGNEDYRDVGSRSLPSVVVTIAPGQTTGTLTLSVVGDENYEPDETVFLQFVHSQFGTITNSAEGIFLVEVTITNDDPVMATSASNLQARPAGSGNLAVSWDPALGAPNGYSVRWRKASESDTALSAVNTVTATSYTITGLDNDTSYHVRLDTRNLANDGIASGTSLTTAVTPTAGAAPTVTAIANQSARAGQPFEVDVDATPGTAGDSLQYQAASSAPVVATVTPTALTAHSASSTVRVTPVAAGTATITVTVSDGTEVDTETFDVTVSQPTLSIAPVAGNGVTVSSSDAQRGEIDEDAASGAVTLEVTLSESSTEAVTVAYATADFSSTDTVVSSNSIDPATAGADYTAASGTLTFAAGDTRKTITVFISDDVNRERDELFKVGLSSATGGASIASSGSEATILIDDDDPRPKATITASVPGLTSTGAPGGTFTTPEGFLSVAEGDSGNTDITFTVTLEGADYLNTSFSVSSTDGSATGNEDYRDVGSRSLPSVVVTIAPGQTTGTLTLSVVGDENYEPDETVFLQFVHSQFGTITNSAEGIFLVEVTITNDDPVMATSASNLRARPAGSGNLAVSWDPAFGAPNGYSVRWRKASESDTALTAVNTVTATSYTITGLDNDTSYHVRLDTRNLANDGIASDTSLTTAATPTAGAAPTVTAIANQSARVGQPFEVDVDATPGTAGDSLQYQAASSAPAVATVTPTALTAHDANSQVTVTPVAAGTATITVTVSDGTEVGTETFDVTVSQVTLGYSAPPPTLTVDTPITALTATATGFGSATVSYAVTTGTLPAGLNISATTGAITGTPTAASTTTTTVTVTATAGTGMDTQTATADITFPAVDKGTLAKPTNLAVKANSSTRTGFTVTWDAVPNAAGYTATATPSGGSAVTGTVDTTGTNPEAAFTGLTANTTYAVTVTATGDANYSMSEASDGFDVTTAANQVPTVGTAIPDQTAMVDTAFEYSFPAGTFSDADSDSLTYTAQQTDGTTDSVLPTWLTFTASERKLAGTPQSGDIGTLMVKVTASDGMGGSVSDTFNIVVSVADTAPAFASSTTIADKTFSVDAEITAFTLPEATGGNGTISYALTPDLPTGLSVDTSTREVSGTPTAAASAATYTWRASDSDSNTANSDTAALTFMLTVNKATLATPSNLALKANTQSKTGFTVTWDAVTNATGYTATATPSGGSAVTGTVSVPSSGPEAVFTGLTAGTTYTVSVVATGNTANYEASTAATLSQATAANAAPTVANVIPDQTATTGTAFSFTLPAGTFSDADSGDSLTYTAQQTDGTTDSALPTWLSFTAGTGVFSGTPTSTDAGTLSVKVTASDGTDSVSDTFDIVVSVADTAPAFASSATIADKTFTVDAEITAFTLPEATGGNGTISYALTPDLPTGLSLDTGTREVSGTPTAAASAAIYTWRASDSDSNTADSDSSALTFMLTVNKATLATPVVTVSAQDGKLTASWGGVANAASYEVEYKQSTSETWLNNDDDTSPAEIDSLTNGTEYDVRVRAKAASASTNYEDSPWSEVKKGTPVETDVAPSFGSETIAAQTWTVGTNVDLTLPAATGGNGTLTYTLSPDLPTGVSLDATTRKVSGTPTAAATEATYTWRASDSDSNTADADTAALTFSVTVGKGTLATPTNLGLKAGSRSKTGFTVTWDAVSNATGYTATAVQGSNTFTGAVTGTEATFTGLAVNTTYTVSVVATGNTANYEASTAATLNQATAANSAPTVANAIPDQAATTGTAFSFTLPAGTFSDADSGDSLTYTAQQTDGTTDSALPTWLSFTAGTGVFSGTPTSTDAGTLSVKVTASDGTASVSDTFDIVVSAADSAPAFASSATIADKTFTVDAEITAFTLPEATGGNGTIGYALTPDLPTGLSLDTSTREVTGTPTAAATAATYTWRASDSDSNTADSDSSALTFMLTVNKATLATPSNLVLKANTQSKTGFTVTWTAVTNATGYTATATPSGGSAVTGTVSVPSTGPEAAFTALTAGTTYTVSVVATGNTANYEASTAATLSQATAANAAPTVANAIPDQMATTGTAFSFTLPAGTFSDADSGDSLTYTAQQTDGTTDSALPTWLSFTAGTGVFSGTPKSTDTGTLSVKVTASDGAASVSDTFDIVVSAADTAPAFADNTTIADKTFTVDAEITTFTLPAATGGNGTISYALTPALPNGVSVDTSTREVSGTPTAAATATTYTWRASDSDSNTANSDSSALTFMLTVNKATLATPANLALKANTRSKTGFTVTWDAVTSATGYTATATPSGGSAVTGTVSTPSSGPEAAFTGLTAGTTYTVSVVATGNTANYEASSAATLSQATAANSAPTVANAIPDQAATVDTAFSFTLPAGTFNDADSGDSLTYTVMQTDGTTDSALPTWLSFTAGTGVFSGTPTSTDTGTLSVKVTASDGTASVSDTFDIVVSAADTAPAFASSTTIADKTFTVDAEITAFTLPEATGGNGTISYALTPDLPMGLSLDTSTREVSGTPTAAATATTYTWRASDGDANTANSDSSALTFMLTVNKVTLATPMVTVSAQDGKLTASWVDVTNAASYEVEYKQSTSDTWLGNDDDTSPAEIDSLTNGTEYDVRVRAKAASDSTTYEDSTWSDVVKGTPVEADVVPSFGSETVAAQTWTVGTEVDVTLPAATGGNGIVSYALTPALPGGVTLNAATRKMTGTPTAAATEATYTWRASDSDSNTANSDTAALTFQVTVVDAAPVMTPTQVSNLQVSAGDGSLEVSWTAASVAPNGYSVRWRERGPGNTLTPVNEVDGTSFTISDLINGQEYVVRVETRTAADDGVQGGTVVTTTGTPVEEKSVVTPTQVSNLQVSAGDGSLEVSWTAASVAPNGYSVRWREKGPGNTLTPVNRVTGTSFTIPDLINDQEYVVRVETRTTADDGIQVGTVMTATGTPVEDEVAPPPPPPTPTPPAVDERGLPRVSIEDASAMEGDDLEFRVVLSKAVQHRVKVYWATRPGTARANRDYKSAAGAVVFRPGVTERRIRVRTMEDSHNDPDETMQVRLSSPRGVLIEDGIATGMINNWDALPVAWLARFGRAVTEQALEGIEQRLTAPREAGTRGTLAGITLAGLTTSNFTHTGAMDASGGSLAFWGRGARADFRGLDGVVHLDGQTETVTLGADYARDEWLTGVMLTSSRGTGGYQGVASGEVEVSLNAAIPYGSYRFSERLDVWGAVGRGTGVLTLTPEGEGSIEADLDWSMVSAGLRGGLFGAAGHGPAVTLVSDVLWSRTGSGRVEAGEGHSSLASSEADTSRLRLGLEGSWAVTLGNVGAVTPKLEAGVRHDDGDAEQGFGMEIGGGLAWTLPALGVTFDVSGRTLVTHEDAGQEAHGFSAALNFDPSAASTRGFTLNLRQDIGGPSSGGVQALFASELPGVGDTGMGGGSTGTSAGTRWMLETAYGLAAYGDKFTLSPSFGLAASDTSVDFHIGWQLMPELSEDALNLSLTFKVTRRELLDVGTVNSIDSIGTLEQGPEHGVQMEVSARW